MLAAPVAERADRDRGGVLAVGLRTPSAAGTCWRKMITRDADREALDHRPRQDARVAAQPRGAGDDQQQPGQQRDDDHAVGPDGGHDRHQHDGHRARRAAHLHVRPAEHAGDDAGHDRGDQPGLGAQPGRDAEAERERQRDDGDGDPGEQIAAPGSRAARRSRARRGSSGGQPRPRHGRAARRAWRSPCRAASGATRRATRRCAGPRASRARSSPRAGRRRSPRAAGPRAAARDRPVPRRSRSSRSETDCSSSLSSSSTRIRTGCPMALKNSAFSCGHVWHKNIDI